MQILLIEDDPTMSKSIEQILARANAQVCSADTGQTGIKLARSKEYNLIMLDLHLPDMSGREVLKNLRSNSVETPILVLSGDDTRESKLASFGLGADDYLTKPFHREELIARIFAIMRRVRNKMQPTIRIDQVVVNLDTEIVKVDGTPLKMTHKEYQVLELLCLRRGRTVTKEMFLNHLYAGIDEPNVKAINVFVCKLRRRLSDATNGTNYIKTIWGQGYMLRGIDH
ncbi:response regulator transcription factor [Yoonia sp. SDW83-1]|uniref:response regulator transcription factor n=1 Tax=Yoonia sp. SDW83-1 TaxID=3366945 RepID=UPI00398C4C59